MRETWRKGEMKGGRKGKKEKGRGERKGGKGKKGLEGKLHASPGLIFSGPAIY